MLPPSNPRPNPLATQDRLYVSVFAAGAICALDRGDGKLIWRRELQALAGASVHLHEQKLFAKTSNTLFALHPDSGETFWSFCPYGTDGESVYSSPSTQEDRVYIGDRRGYLHCLDTESGKTIWRQHTNTGNGDVNSTPVLMEDLVIVSTNAKTVVAYEARSGKLAWKQDLDGPSVYGPIVHQDSVLAVSHSLYMLDPKTGRVKRRFLWRDEQVGEADSTPRSIVFTFRDQLDTSSVEPRVKTTPKKLTTLITKSGLQRTTTFVASCTSLRYVPAAGLVYLSHLGGVDLFHPETGALLCRLNTSADTCGGIALVDVMDRKIYVLTGDGSVHALRHPAPLRGVVS